MRVALSILLGLFIGIIGTVSVMNTLHQRNPLPHAVMSVMARQVKDVLVSRLTFVPSVSLRLGWLRRRGRGRRSRWC